MVVLKCAQGYAKLAAFVRHAAQVAMSSPHQNTCAKAAWYLPGGVRSFVRAYVSYEYRVRVHQNKSKN